MFYCILKTKYSIGCSLDCSTWHCPCCLTEWGGRRSQLRRLHGHHWAGRAALLPGRRRHDDWDGE